MASCSVVLVQPYDEALINGTDAFFKKASAVIDGGIAVSPRTDADREAIKKPSDSPAHSSRFGTHYNELGTDVDALLLRATAKSQLVGPAGDRIQREISQLIDEALPSQCATVQAALVGDDSSLTVRNLVDLKCIVIGWKSQHEDPDFTQGTSILKRASWETRRSSLFAAVLEVERAELSKKPR